MSTGKIPSFFTLTLQRIWQESSIEKTSLLAGCLAISPHLQSHAQGGEARTVLAKSLYYPYNRVVSYPQSTISFMIVPCRTTNIDMYVAYHGFATHLYNIVFAHGTVTKDNQPLCQRAWTKLTPIQSLLTLSTPLGAPARMFSQ